jgi:hypothetical protein
MRYLSISDRNRTSGSSTCKVLHQPVSTFDWLFQALPCAGFLSLRTVLHCPGKGGDCTCEACLQAAIGMSSFVLGRISLSKRKSVVMYGAMSLGSIRMCADLDQIAGEISGRLPEFEAAV